MTVPFERQEATEAALRTYLAEPTETSLDTFLAEADAHQYAFAVEQSFAAETDRESR